MQNIDYQTQGIQDLEKIQGEFLDRILEALQLEKQDISMQLLEILNQACISLESIQDKFNEILEEKQLNLIVSIANEYHLRYLAQRQKIERNLNESINYSTTSNTCVKNKQIIYEKHQKIHNEDFDKVSQIIKPNLETANYFHLDQSLNYLATKVDNSNQSESELQDIFENVHLKTNQTNQMLKTQEELMVDQKENKEQIVLQKQKNTQMQEGKSTKIVTDVEINNKETSVQNNQICAIQTKIQELQNQINLLINQFQEYVVKQLNDQCKQINMDDVNLLVGKLSLDNNLQNESEHIEKIIQSFDLARKQEKSIKAEMKKFSDEIMKIKEAINEQVVKIQELKVLSEKQLISKKEMLINELIEQISQITQKDWTQTNKDILTELINYIQISIGKNQQISEEKILNIIENAELSRSKENQVQLHINNFISEYKQIFSSQGDDAQLQTETDLYENFIKNLILQINEICQLDWNQVHKEILEKLNSYCKDIIKQNKKIDEETVLSIIKQAEVSKNNEKKIINAINLLSLEYQKLIKTDESNIQQQIAQKKYLIDDFIKNVNEISQLDWVKNHHTTLNKLLCYLKETAKLDTQLNEQKILSFIENLELSGIKERKIISQAKSFLTQYKVLLEDIKILNKEQNQQKEVIQINERIYKKDQSLSKIYTLVYQQKDYCLDTMSLKVICDFQNVQELINQLKQNEVKTIGLYGDFKLAIKIIQSYYPSSPQLIDLDQYISQDYDKLVAVTDGQLVFLILQEQKNAFEGDVFDNEESQLYIRFLLDSCSILITCLNQKQVSLWSDNNPFGQFQCFVPPKQYKDRSSIFLKQWIIFANDTKKNSLGKIKSDYTFEEGRLDKNIYYQQTQYGNTIERVDSCIILNEKNNVIILYEKKKKQFYEFFISGELKEIRFELSREISNDGVIAIQNIQHEESGDIQSIKNTFEGDFYFFQTEKCIYLTNHNYIVKHQIPLKENLLNFKLIIIENASLLVTLYENNEYECYLIQGIEDLDDSDNNSNLSVVKAKIGNIVIDKIIQSMVYYGNNYKLIGCPNQVDQLFFYENSLDNHIQNFGKQIEEYFNKCMLQKYIQFKITNSEKNCFNNIDLLINKLDSMIQNTDSIKCQDLQFIMQTRIPIQITTIQQANYLPLKDGLFKQDLMNIPEVEDQIEQIKKQISFGWIESLIQSQNQDVYTVSMCGRQSVGKSSQLNRMFGTRFGVSASRCTDGIWMGLSKVDDKLILVLDCEGLFSIRRTDDEEVKLLQQITSISDITIVFCDIDGINQPLLSLFKKLQICSGKMQSDSFFLGTMVLLTKNVQDQGDQKKLFQEGESHLNKKETKNTISKIFRRGFSFGFLKNYLDKDYDSNLQNVRDELLYKQILQKNQARNPKFLMNTLKYSMIQIYLNDDQDIDLINKQSEIKECYDKFVALIYDISQQNFISNERLMQQFEYKPISDDEKVLMKEEVFEYQQQDCDDDDDDDDDDNINDVDEQDYQSELIKLQFEENIQGYEYHLKQQIDTAYPKFKRPSTLENIKQLEEEIYDDQDKRCLLEQQQEIDFQQEHQAQYNYKSYNILQIKQQEVKFYPQQAQSTFSENKSQNNMLLENIFQNCFRILQRINFNNYIDQMQSFFDSFIGQRTNTIQEYFNNRMPKDSKYSNIVLKFQQKINNVIHLFKKQFVICKNKCNKCNRFCINISGHKGDCNCETYHKCYTKCQKCNNNNECFLISGHQGIHYCKEVNHLCQEPCQISNSCKELCTLVPHSDNIKHSCQSEHKCEHQCRLYDKCGKSCSLQSGHEEINHLCDSTQCYDKCKFCDKLCGFNLHDHDVLLSNQEKNKELLMKEGKLVTQHLCGDQHNCLEKCEKAGVCSITYKTEEKTWETATSKFEYQFIKPNKSQKQCNVKIQPWQITHDGEHQCESAHRCDQQCPECLSYCFENYNHIGNHKSKNHRNKEKCIFVSETDQIKINYELGNIRKYLPGENSTPENCLQSCLRMGRAHIHLKVCEGGDKCAEKKYPYARHSTKQYKPYTDLIYDEMLCKGYWNNINWEPPVEGEHLQIIQSCNVGCSHDSHTSSPNYCTRQAWHEGQHQIDPKKCEHLGSGIVDICFTIDTTGSMGWAMNSVRETVISILRKFEGRSDIMYSIVSYRDHPPQESSYVFKIDSQLTNQNEILEVLSNMRAKGGGDAPEAVMDGLYNSITSINWRDHSQRFIFHICGSPPHGKQFGISSSDRSWTDNGCPCGINEYQIANQLKARNVFYYLVKVHSSLNMMENIFKNTFGQFYKQTIYLDNLNELNIEIVEVLTKEINLMNEFYHIQD